MLSYTLMDRIPLKAADRTILGKKVKQLRAQGIIPGHVYGNIKEVEHVQITKEDFLKAFKVAGETGLVNLKIGEDRTRPVLIKELDVHPVTDQILHVGFYQVNLKEKVTVPVPLVLVGEEVETVKLGQTVVLQNMSEIMVEALPADFIDKIEVNIEVLKEVGDSITVADLSYDRTLLTVQAEPEEVVVKLDDAVTDEMKALLAEQEAEQAASQEVAETEASTEGREAGEKAEGEAGVEGEAAEGETKEGGEAGVENKENSEDSTDKSS